MAPKPSRRCCTRRLLTVALLVLLGPCVVLILIEQHRRYLFESSEMVSAFDAKSWVLNRLTDPRESEPKPATELAAQRPPQGGTHHELSSVAAPLIRGVLRPGTVDHFVAIKKSPAVAVGSPLVKAPAALPLRPAVATTAEAHSFKETVSSVKSGGSAVERGRWAAAAGGGATEKSRSAGGGPAYPGSELRLECAGHGAVSLGEFTRRAAPAWLNGTAAARECRGLAACVWYHCAEWCADDAGGGGVGPRPRGGRRSGQGRSKGGSGGGSGGGSDGASLAAALRRFDESGAIEVRLQTIIFSLPSPPP